MAGWTAGRENDGDVGGDQASDEAVKWTIQHLLLVDDRESHAGPFWIVHGQIVGLELDQDPAFVGTPLLTEPSKVAPTTMVFAANRIPVGMDRAPAFVAKVSAGNPRQFLELPRVDVKDHAAYGTFSTAPVFDQVHPCVSCHFRCDPISLELFGNRQG